VASGVAEEEPAQDAASITMAPRRILAGSVIRLMSFYTFLREPLAMMLHNRGLWSSLLPEFEKMLRKRKNASTPTKSKKRVSCAHEMNEIPRLQSLLFSGVRGRGFSPKFGFGA